MTGPEHYREAERLLAEVATDDGGIDFGDVGDEYVAAAQVHATLALAAATALHKSEGPERADLDDADWMRAASEYADRMPAPKDGAQ